MIEVEKTNPVGASKGSGCCCASKTPAVVTAVATKAGCCGGGHDHAEHDDQDASIGDKVRDPVCGMTVDPATSQHRFDYRGEAYHFCSGGWATKFAADPTQYLDKTKPKAAAPAGTIYTCPMHHQIRQVGPGNCPICGMTLEPEVASLDAPPNPALPAT